MSDDDIEASQIFLESSRFWIQKVFVPILVLVGVAGNVVTVMVLTRRRMRCTTHIYLTALALADLIYLLFVLVLSFEHYPNIHNRRYELYWRFYGITHWLCDAASSTSVWLTVSFTIERYIIVCHPIRGKVYCTESRAKNIITVISLLCLISTASTTFEHQLTWKEHCVQKHCDVEKDTHKQENDSMYVDDSRLMDERSVDVQTTLQDHTSSKRVKRFELVEITDDLSKNSTEIDFLTNESRDNLNLVIAKRSEPKNPNFVCKPIEEEDKIEKPFRDICTPEHLNSSDCISNDTCCVKSYTIYTEPTELGKNVTYTSIFYWFSSITFGLLPLVLIAAFNCFLIKAVLKSTKARHAITNSAESSRERHENKITILLIGIIVLFLLCQTPTASFLIYDALDGVSSTVTRNTKRALGNICNLLLTVNASCNFIMYCVLSKNYRSTLKSVFGARKLNRQDTSAFSVSRTSRYRPQNGFRRNLSEYRTPRNLETQSLTSMPRSKSLMMRPIGKARSTDLNV